MTDVRVAPVSGNEISLQGLGSTALRWRRGIMLLGFGGAALGLAFSLLSPRLFTSSATFIPQSSENELSSLALAASQFGIRMPSTSSGWGPPVYVELLRSQALLAPIALDSLEVPEEGGRRMAMMDLLRVGDMPAGRRTERAVKVLRNKILSTGEDKKLGAVRLSVSTRWPSVSLQVAERLITSVNQFNLESRKSQAAAERQFVELQSREAERALREAEDRLQAFLQRNRATSSSPDLMFARDRLERDVALRQSVYTSLMQSFEQARIREVRDTPVITVLETPRIAATGKPRGTAIKTIFGGVLGGALGLLIALVGDGLAGRQATSDESREFYRLLHEATPRFLRRARPT